MKKYYNAHTRKEMMKNFKYIQKEYYKNDKMILSAKAFVKTCWDAISLSGEIEEFNEDLYDMYTNEIRLFYANNAFPKEKIIRMKNELKYKSDRKGIIIIPLILSIIASFIASEFLGKIIIPLLIKMGGAYGDVWKTFFEGISTFRISIVGLFQLFLILLMLFLLFGFLMALVYIIVWLIVKGIKLISWFLYGRNHTQVMALMYEIDYIDEIISKNVDVNDIHIELENMSDRIIPGLKNKIRNYNLLNKNSFDIEKEKDKLILWMKRNKDLQNLENDWKNSNILLLILLKAMEKICEDI